MLRSVFVLALGVDLLLLVAFAALGRNSHDDGASAGDVLTTAAPFVIGYTISAIATRLDRAPLSISRAAVAWAPGIALGLLLRVSLFGRGIAPAFIVVSIVTTAVLLIGWRLAVPAVSRLRA